MRFPRWPAIVVLAALVVGLVILDRRDRPDETTALDVTSPASMPVAPGGDALGSTWYCAGGTVAPGGFADHRVIVVNPGTEPVGGVVTVYGAVVEDGVFTPTAPVRTTVSVAPGTTSEIVLADLVTAGFAAALLELDQPDAIVEHRVVGPTGSDHAPCSSAAGEAWYFPAGATSRDAREVLALFNPFPDEAVVDITFATDDGGRAPQIYDNLVVPAGSLLPIDVTEVVSRWDQVSAAVLVRSGRLVADRLVSFDGSRGLTGLTLSSGASQPALQWIFPLGETAPGLTDSYVIYNPSDRSAEVDLEVRLDNPDVNGEIEPFELTVPPAQRVVVVINDTDVHPRSANATVLTGGRVPPGVDHWVSVLSFNGVPIVAERLRTSVPQPAPVAEPEPEPEAESGAPAEPDPDAPTEEPVAEPADDEIQGAQADEGEGVPEADGEPLDGSVGVDGGAPEVVAPDPLAAIGGGVTTTMGAPLAGTTLVVGLNRLPESGVELLAVVNPSFSTIARVSVDVIIDGERLAVADLRDVELAARRRLSVPDLSDLLVADSFILVIESTAPVVAERGIATDGLSGLTSSMATPVGGEVVTPALLGP